MRRGAIRIPRRPHRADREARDRGGRASGTGLVGDVSNTLVTLPLLREAGMAAQVFYELLGFNDTDGMARVWDARTKIGEYRGKDPAVRVALAAHAPYSVSPELFRAIRADIDGDSAVSTVHLAIGEARIRAARAGLARPDRESAQERRLAPHGGRREYLAYLVSDAACLRSTACFHGRASRACARSARRSCRVLGAIDT